MALNFIKPITTINGADSDNKPLHFFDKGFLLGGGHEPQYQDVTVSGNNYVNLPNAKADGLNYLKLFGGTVQQAQTYIDSVTAEGKCEQRRLPEGYTELEYLQSDASAYINTHFNSTSNSGLKIKYRYVANGSAAISGIYTPGTPRTDALFVSSGSGTTNGTNEAIFATTNGLASGTLNYPLSLNTDYVVEVNYLNNGEVYINDTFNRNCGTETPNNGDILLFARKNASTDNITASNSRIYYAEFTEGQNVVKKFIPCKRNSDNILGMYDVINDVFETNTGSGSFTAGADVTPTPTAPIPIWCNNGVLKVRNKSGLPLGYTKLDYIETDGNCWIEIPIVPDITTEFEITASNIISVACQLMVTQASISNNYFMIGKATATEKVVGRIGADSLTSSIDGVAKFTAKVNASSFYVNGSKIGNFTSTALSGLGNVDLFRGVYPGATYYTVAGPRVHEAIIRKSGSEVFHGIPAKNSSNVIGLYDTVTNTFLINKGSGSLIAGSVDDSVEIYTDGTTETVTDAVDNVATCQNLLSVDTYKDTQEILSGAVTRNIGIKVLDGTEDWVDSSTPNVFLVTFADKTGKKQAYCTHFNYSTDASYAIADNEFGANNQNIYYFKYSPANENLDNWKTFLRQQLTNGTPIIVVYPKSSATTSSVTAQPMTIQQGTNVIEITQASMDDLELEAQYKAGVAVTITEIENVNLDNSVTVTIG